MKFLRLIKHELAAEIQDWQSKGIISSESAQKICELYDISPEDKKTSEGGISTLYFLSAFLLGLAFILLVSFNWYEISPTLRLIGTCIIILSVSYGADWLLKNGKWRTSEAVLLLASITFMAGVFLVGQMYHLGINFEIGYLISFLGIFPVLYLTRNCWIGILCITLLLQWTMFQLTLGRFPIESLVGTGFLFFAWSEQRSRIFFYCLVAFGIFLGCAGLNTLLLPPGTDLLTMEEFSAYYFLPLPFIFVLTGTLLESSASAATRDAGMLLKFTAMRASFVLFLFVCTVTFWEGLYELVNDNKYYSISNTLSIIMTVIIAGLTGLTVIRKTSRSSMLFGIIGYGIMITTAPWFITNMAPAPFSMAWLISIIGMFGGMFLCIDGTKSRRPFLVRYGATLIVIIAFMKFFTLSDNYVFSAMMLAAFAVALIFGAGFLKKITHTERV